MGVQVASPLPPDGPGTDGLTAAGDALGARLRQLSAALARHDAFVFGHEVPSSPPATADPGDDNLTAATALVLRALRCASDATGWRVMERLAGRHLLTTTELAGALGCPRLVAWEQVNDLVQAGLAVRALDGDGVSLTPAGRGLTALVKTLAADTAASAATGGGTR